MCENKNIGAFPKARAKHKQYLGRQEMKKFREIFVTVMIFLLFFSAMAYGITWSTKKRLTNNEGGSGSPAIAVDGSNVYVVWCDDTPGIGD